MTLDEEGIVGKWLALLKEISPNLSRGRPPGPPGDRRRLIIS